MVSQELFFLLRRGVERRDIVMISKEDDDVTIVVVVLVVVVSFKQVMSRPYKLFAIVVVVVVSFKQVIFRVSFIFPIHLATFPFRFNINFIILLVTAVYHLLKSLCFTVSLFYAIYSNEIFKEISFRETERGISTSKSS